MKDIWESIWLLFVFVVYCVFNKNLLYYVYKPLQTVTNRYKPLQTVSWMLFFFVFSGTSNAQLNIEEVHPCIAPVTFDMYQKSVRDQPSDQEFIDQYLLDRKSVNQGLRSGNDIRIPIVFSLDADPVGTEIEDALQILNFHFDTVGLHFYNAGVNIVDLKLLEDDDKEWYFSSTTGNAIPYVYSIHYPLPIHGAIEEGLRGREYFHAGPVINILDIENGKMSTVWVDWSIDGSSLNQEERLFSVYLLAKHSCSDLSNLFQLDHHLLKSKFVNRSLEHLDIQISIDFEKKENIEGSIDFLQPNKLETNVICYPSPANFSVTTSINVDTEGEITIRLRDVYGHLLKTINESASEGQYIKIINLSDISETGLILISIEMPNGTIKTTSFIKE